MGVGQVAYIVLEFYFTVVATCNIMSTSKQAFSRTVQSCTLCKILGVSRLLNWKFILVGPYLPILHPLQQPFTPGAIN